MIAKLISKLYERILHIRAQYQLSQFAEHGEHVFLGIGGDFIPSHIHCGHHVHIGPHASFMASIAHIYRQLCRIWAFCYNKRGQSSYRFDRQTYCGDRGK